jgi:hypothetical protein
MGAIMKLVYMKVSQSDLDVDKYHRPEYDSSSLERFRNISYS